VGEARSRFPPWQSTVSVVLKAILDEEVTEWVRRSLDAHGQIGVLAGSAISVWEPSCLPTATGLRDSIVKALFYKNRLLADLQAELEGQLLSSKDTRSLRLETVLEEIDLHVPNELPRFISVLDSGEPNSIHYTLADWLRSGRISVLYTTNQDRLIERALELRAAQYGRDFTVVTPETPETEKSDSPASIVKLHGTIDRTETIRTTFTQVGQGLPTKMTEALENDLRQYPFLVIGYSGQDVDIRPSFLRSTPRDVLWIDRKGSFSSSHFAIKLKEAHKNVIPHVADLSQFNLDLEKLRDGSGIGKNRAAAEASEAAVGIPAGKLALICSRVINRSAELPSKRKLQKQCLTRAAQTAEVKDSPNLGWRVPYYRAEEHLFRATFLVRDVAAFYFYCQSTRMASNAKHLFGRITGLFGAGLAVDMFGLGLLPTAYRASVRFCYLPALLAIQRAGSPPSQKTALERAILKELVLFHIARAYFRTGRRQKAVFWMGRLAEKGKSSFIRGHCHRFLGLYYASTGKFPDAENSINNAREQFLYLEREIAKADTLRNRAAVKLLERQLWGAWMSAGRAFVMYRRGNVRRGEIRAWVLLRFIAACERVPSLLSSGIAKRLVIGL